MGGNRARKGPEVPERREELSAGREHGSLGGNINTQYWSIANADGVPTV